MLSLETMFLKIAFCGRPGNEASEHLKINQLLIPCLVVVRQGREFPVYVVLQKAMQREIDKTGQRETTQIPSLILPCAFENLFDLSESQFPYFKSNNSKVE